MSARVQRSYSTYRSGSRSGLSVKSVNHSKRTSSTFTPSNTLQRYNSSTNISRANSITSKSSMTRNSLIFPSSDYRPSTKGTLQRSSSFHALPLSSNRDYSLVRSSTVQLNDDMIRDSNVAHESVERRVDAFQKTSRALNRALLDSETRDMNPKEKAKRMQKEIREQQMMKERTSQQQWQDFLTRGVLLARAVDMLRRNPRAINKQSWNFQYSPDGPSSPEDYDVPSDTELVVMKTY